MVKQAGKIIITAILFYWCWAHNETPEYDYPVLTKFRPGANANPLCIFVHMHERDIRDKM